MAKISKKSQYDTGDIVEVTNKCAGLEAGAEVIVSYPYKDSNERIRVIDKHGTEHKVITKYLKRSGKGNMARRARLTSTYHGFSQNSFVTVISQAANADGCVSAVDAMGSVDFVPETYLDYV